MFIMKIGTVLKVNLVIGVLILALYAWYLVSPHRTSVIHNNATPAQAYVIASDPPRAFQTGLIGETIILCK